MSEETKKDDGKEVIYADGGGTSSDSTLYSSSSSVNRGGTGSAKGATIKGSKGDDVLYGGSGDDKIKGGSGNDTIYAGDGDDSATGGKGDDVIYLGDGDDIGSGKAGEDSIYGGAGDDTLIGGKDDDVLAGGEGNDLIKGGSGNDTLCGDDGKDTLYGGKGDDALYGGKGNDVLIGGSGSDSFYVGRGGGNDVVMGDKGHGSSHSSASAHASSSGSHHGSSSSKDNDTLYVEGPAEIRLHDGTVISANTGDTINLKDYATDDGTVTLDDNTKVQFDQIETIKVVDGAAVKDPEVCICFTPGTLIATPMGARPVESLREGDRVITRDNGIREICWAGQKALTSQMMALQPQLRPILIKAGSLGENLPERDMMVSPNHRMLVANERTSLYFEEHEVLVAAKHMLRVPGIERAEVAQTSYVHIMFEQHEVVLADGTWTESFQPGDYSLDGLGNAQRNEIFELFPELRETKGRESYIAARPTLKKNEAAVLFAAAG